MLGGVGANEEVFTKYVHELSKSAADIVGTEGRLHLFIAQGASVLNLERVEAESHDKFSLHLLGTVNAKEVGSLMHNGVTITKSGGGTIAELVTMGGTAVFDTSLSQHIRWEKYAYELFHERGWGSILDPTGSSEMGPMILKAFANRKASKESMLKTKNQFHLDWPFAVVTDLLAIQKKKTEGQLERTDSWMRKLERADSWMRRKNP